MIKKQVVRPVRKTLRKPKLKGYWFYHASMYGTYKTPCHIVERLVNENMVLIEYFDFVIDEWQDRLVAPTEVHYG